MLLPRFRREIRETDRFVRDLGGGEDLGHALRRWLDPLLGILRQHPGRALGIALLGSLAAGGHASGFQIMGDYLLTDRAWQPWQYSTLFILGGPLRDRRQPGGGALRRPLRAARGRLRRCWRSFPLFMALFYRSDGWLIPAAWIPAVFAVSGGATVIRALSTELFPTSSRGTATGWLMLLETGGAALALAAVTRLTPEGESVVARRHPALLPDPRRRTRSAHVPRDRGARARADQRGAAAPGQAELRQLARGGAPGSAS